MKRAAAAILILSSALACQKKAAPPTTSSPHIDGDTIVFGEGAPQVSSFKSQPAARQADERVTVTGRLVWNEDATARVFSPVAGRIEGITADLGKQIAAGAPLVMLSSPDFGQAQSDAVRAAADLSSAERALERARQLHERGAAPRKDLEQAEADRSRAHAEAQRTEARLSRWGGARGAVDQGFHLASPIGGTVVEKNVNPGMEVRPDSQTPLYVVSDPSRLWILLDVTERDLAAVLPGAALTIRTPAFSGRTFEGTVKVVGSSLDPATRTLKARGVVDNRERLLKAEMYVTAELVRRSASGLVVPARAVLQDGGGRKVVFLEEKPGRYRRLIVGVGREQDGKVPIVSGLDTASQVVTDGALLLEAAFQSGGDA